MKRHATRPLRLASMFVTVLLWGVSQPCGAQQKPAPEISRSAGHGRANLSAAADLARSAQTPQPTVATVDLNVLAAEIAQEMRTNPNLQGAWLYVEADDQGDPGVAIRLFRFRRVFDCGRTGLQQQEMDRLIRRWLPSGNYRVNAASDSYLPVSDLLAELRDRIDLQPKFAGANIQGAYFQESTSGGGLNLVLRGRIYDESQVEQIEKLCTEMMSHDPIWAHAGVHPSTHSKDDLDVVKPSALNARLFFAEGLQNFWKSRYSAASSAFRQATLEAPKNLEYHYWRVLSELIQGQRQRAFERLQNLVRAFGIEPLSRQHAEIARSLERIQGPLRRELREMELRAVTNVSQTKNTAVN